jgi:hypothetical protein
VLFLQGYGPKKPLNQSGNKNNWGDIYLGDTGTAVQTLTLCYHLTMDQSAKVKYLDRINKVCNTCLIITCV